MYIFSVTLARKMTLKGTWRKVLTWLWSTNIKVFLAVEKVLKCIWWSLVFARWECHIWLQWRHRLARYSVYDSTRGHCTFLFFFFYPIRGIKHSQHSQESVSMELGGGERRVESHWCASCSEFGTKDTHHTVIKLTVTFTLRVSQTSVRHIVKLITNN